MRYLTSALILTIFLFSSAFSQKKVLSLEEAKNLALERNMSVIQAQNNVEAAKSGKLAAFGRYLPSLSGNGSWRRSRSEGPLYIQGINTGLDFTLTQGNFSAGLNTSLLLFDGLEREANYSRSQSDFSATEHTATRTRQSVVFQVVSSYLNVLRLEQLVKVSEENLKRDQRQLERITESNRVGALSLADVYRQQSQVASDEFSLITAQNDFDKAKADLAALIGLDDPAGCDFSDVSISTSIDSTELATTAAKYADVQSLMNRALVSRPDYLGAQENLSSSESGVTVARSNYFPSLSAFAGMNWTNENISELTRYVGLNWGLSLNWTLFDGFATNQSLQSAMASKRNAEISMVQAERIIRVDITKATLDLEAAKKQYEVSQKALVSASEDRKIAEERYNLGAGTLLDLLVANAGLVNAEANTVNASYNYIISKRNVEYVIGERTY
jgi:outer membrane protein